MLPPGTGAAGQRVRSRLELRAEITAAGEEALSGGERLGVKQRAVLEALRAGEMSAPELAARGRLRPRPCCAGSRSAA